MGFSVPAAISDSVLPSCIPSLLSSLDVIVAEGYSVSYSPKRVTGGKEPGRALFVEVMLPSVNVPSHTGRRRVGEAEKHTTGQMGRQQNYSRVSLHRYSKMSIHTARGFKGLQRPIPVSVSLLVPPIMVFTISCRIIY